jgi:uncharacterized protein YidB (DUF937 family)
VRGRQQSGCRFCAGRKKVFDEITHRVAARFGLGGKAGPLIQMLIAEMIQPQTGALPGFMERIRKAGFGQIVESWFDGGDVDAHPISSRQLGKLLGGHGGLLEAVQNRLGIGSSVASAALAYTLPRVITRLMPGGKAPVSAPPEVQAFASGARNWLLHAEAPARSIPPRSGLSRALPWLVVALAIVLLSYCAKGPNEDPTGTAAPDVIPEGAAAFSLNTRASS